jgi:hypothetical protein
MDNIVVNTVMHRPTNLGFLVVSTAQDVIDERHTKLAETSRDSKLNVGFACHMDIFCCAQWQSTWS